MTQAPNPAAFARSLADRAASPVSSGVDIIVAGDGGETSVAVVDEALAALSGLDELPCGERVAVFEAVHERLQDILATVDDA